MEPVEAEFATEAEADSYIAILNAAHAANITKTNKDGKFIVTFDEPTDA